MQTQIKDKLKSGIAKMMRENHKKMEQQRGNSPSTPFGVEYQPTSVSTKDMLFT